MNQKTLFYLAVGLQLLILVGIIGYKQYTLSTGESVLLKMSHPVDPMSLFSGNYIILSYEISTINLTQTPSDYGDFKPGDQVYVKLKKDGEYATVESVGKNKPEGLFMKGKVSRVVKTISVGIDYGDAANQYHSHYSTSWDDYNIGDNVYVQTSRDDPREITSISLIKPVTTYRKSFNGTVTSVEKNITQLSINYGIESYYIPQEKAREIEDRIQKTRREGVVSVGVRVDSLGNAVIEKIFLNDEELDL